MSDTDTATADVAALNEPSADKPHRCRTTFSPDHEVYLTDGEVHDHQQWGTLLELDGEQIDTAGTALAPDATPVDVAPSAVPGKTGTGADAIGKQANAGPPVPTTTSTASEPADKKAGSS